MLASDSRRCPKCQQVLDWTVTAVCQHFMNIHGQSLTPGQAHRLLTSRLTYDDQRVPEEGLSRNFREVQGGLPSLPKRR